MSIPLDRLYHYIEHLSQQLWQGHVLIYRFYPHGSKDLNNLKFLEELDNFSNLIELPHIYCNDQEPLDYEKYQTETHISDEAVAVCKSMNYSKMNIRDYPIDIWDKAVLIHSEQRSNNVVQYQEDQFITVYYWSHAIIAREWFRYAEHVRQTKQVEKTFLIYNRAWSGTREYRLKFAETLLRLGLEDDCRMSVNPIEPELEIHYDQHIFINPMWRPISVLENYFPVSDAHSHYSADFDIEDYNSTAIEVVLETLFDDNRLHLTEKILRPVACGQPFILASTHYSLEYLRSYGFKTFGHIWNEQYDQEINPQYRLHAIADLMKQISQWAPWVREKKLAEAQVIAEYNRQHFFSKEFFEQITGELRNNLAQALIEMQEQNTSERWLTWQEQLKATWVKNPQLISNLLEPPNDIQWQSFVNTAKKYNTRKEI